MSRPGNRPRRPILFAAVTAEEKGLLGAQFLSRHPVTGDGRIDRRGQSRHADPDLRFPGRDRVRRRAFDDGADRRAGGGADGRRASRPTRCPRRGCSPAPTITASSSRACPSVFLMTGFANGGERAVPRLPRHPLPQRRATICPGLQLAGRRQVRPAELSDRARDRRRRRGAALVPRAASSAMRSAATSRERRGPRRPRGARLRCA